MPCYGLKVGIIMVWIAAILMACSSNDRPVPAPGLDGAVGWLNTDKPVRLADLRGKVVLLDFWTYCCINCMHVLPDLAFLEKKYANQLVVVGVHSAKFNNEKDTGNIRSAILRYEIRHPVANDANFRIWRRYGVNAWPTLVLIDPEGNLVGAVSGEGHREVTDRTIAQLVSEHRAKGTLNESPIRFALEHEAAESLLLFPGKIAADAPSRRLFISDSNHNRIVIANTDGTILDIAGTGAPGLDDGPFERATFRRPQGLALSGATLFVADTENHAIRAVDLAKRRVETFAGNGAQGNRMTMNSGRDTQLSSPWDLAIVGGKMYIAMAGAHQLWQADLATREFRVFAGSGRENIVDGPARSAQLAQPSGLTYGDGCLYFADSEVSAVRRVGIGANGRVETVVGAGLFDFGDVDGAGEQARLQHPLGVLWHDGKILVADTYNHRVKVLDPASRKITSLIGTGKPGNGDGAAASLYEPGGLAVLGNELYIADTNNHRIAVADIKTHAVHTLNLRFAEEALADLDPAKLSVGDARLRFRIALPPSAGFTPNAPFALRVVGQGAVQVGDFKGDAPATEFLVPLVARGNGALVVTVDAYYCDKRDGSLCGVFIKKYRLPINAGTQPVPECSIVADVPPLR